MFFLLFLTAAPVPEHAPSLIQITGSFKSTKDKPDWLVGFYALTGFSFMLLLVVSKTFIYFLEFAEHN